MADWTCAKIRQNQPLLIEKKSTVVVFPTGRVANEIELSQYHVTHDIMDHGKSKITDNFIGDLQIHFHSTREQAEGFVEKHPYVGDALTQYESRDKAPTSTLATAPEGTERVLFTRREVPEKAPALWAEAKQPGDTPPAFIQHHYAPWMNKGFTQADLRHLDPQCEMALRNWRRKNKDPEWFNLPTKHEQLAAKAQHLVSSDPLAAAAVRRLAYRLDRERSRDR